jgi:hypothetical protein
MKEYAYLMFDPLSKLCKIGRGNNPPVRYLTARVFNPRIYLLWFSSGKSERELHDKYSAKRIELEWFDLTIKDIVEITEIENLTFDNILKNKKHEEVEASLLKDFDIPKDIKDALPF